jgi:hypothetical protein
VAFSDKFWEPSPEGAVTEDYKSGGGGRSVQTGAMIAWATAEINERRGPHGRCSGKRQKGGSGVAELAGFHPRCLGYCTHLSPGAHFSLSLAPIHRRIKVLSPSPVSHPRSHYDFPDTQISPSLLSSILFVYSRVLFSGCKIRRENLWFVYLQPTTGSPSVFCSQKKEPWCTAHKSL